MLLLYCMIQDDVPSPCAGITGIGGAEIKDAATNGVRYLYSEWHPAHGTDEIRQQAVQFHRVNQKLLEQTTLLPFRFPTHVANEADLMALMQGHSSQYSQELARLAGMVQMKITIEGSSHVHVAAKTGAEYLRQRQMANAPMESAIQAVKHAMNDMTHNVKQRRQGNSAILFLLLDRDRIEAVKTKLAELAELQAKVAFSGPWPPSEFVNCYPEIVKP